MAPVSTPHKAAINATSAKQSFQMGCPGSDRRSSGVLEDISEKPSR